MTQNTKTAQNDTTSSIIRGWMVATLVLVGAASAAHAYRASLPTLETCQHEIDVNACLGFAK